MTTIQRPAVRVFFAVAGLLASMLAATTLTQSPAHAADNVVVMNPEGGKVQGDGLRVTYASGLLQVHREGIGQLYGPQATPPTWELYNYFAMAVGTPENGGTVFSSNYWYNRYDVAGNATRSAWTIDTTGNDSSFTSEMTGTVDGKDYKLVLEGSYVAPQDFFTLTYRVDVPEGNTVPVRLYHMFDTYLEGSDTGPGFLQEATACANAMIGVERSDIETVEALQHVAGQPWSSYSNGTYFNVVEGYGEFGPGFFNDLPNDVITDPDNDHAMGTAWTFGPEAGTYSTTSRLIFSREIPDDCPTQIEFVGRPGYAPGKAIPITVSVTAAGDQAPSGQVDILDGDEVLCTADVDETGLATCEITVNGPPGPLTALFRGSNGYTNSQAAPTAAVLSAPVPVIDSISVSEGPISGGTEITIEGSDFEPGATVSIGGAECSDATVTTTSITCTTPAHPAGSVDIKVTNPAPNESGLAASATAEDIYTYVIPVGIELTGTPALYVRGVAFTISAKVEADQETPTGTVEFRQGDQVLCSGLVDDSGVATCEFTANDNELTIEAVFVGTGLFRGLQPATATIRATAAVPTVSAIEPNTGPAAGGQQVTITGTAFEEGASVTIGSAACSDAVVQPTSITCTTGPGAAGTVDVTVTNPVPAVPRASRREEPQSQSATLPNAYTYTAAAQPGTPPSTPPKVEPSPTPETKKKPRNNRISAFRVSVSASGKRTVTLRGTSKRADTRVMIYRAESAASPARVVKVVHSSDHSWTSKRTPMGDQRSAVFCARFNSQDGPLSAGVRVSGKGHSSVAGEVMRCPRR